MHYSQSASKLSFVLTFSNIFHEKLKNPFKCHFPNVTVSLKPGTGNNRIETCCSSHTAPTEPQFDLADVISPSSAIRFTYLYYLYMWPDRSRKYLLSRDGHCTQYEHVHHYSMTSLACTGQPFQCSLENKSKISINHINFLLSGESKGNFRSNESFH